MLLRQKLNTNYSSKLKKKVLSLLNFHKVVSL
ncbi:Uncharacterised protein [Serratia quinivorans]|nr:Uncharacterised protein [Serratia quinivorans]